MFSLSFCTRLQVSERLLVLVKVFIFLREGESDLYFPAPVCDIAGRKGFKLRQVIARLGLHAQLRAVQVCFIVQGLERDDSIVVFLRSLQVADKAAHGRPVVSEQGLIGGERQGAVVGGKRSMLLAQVTAQGANRIPSGRIGSGVPLGRIRRIERIGTRSQR